MAILLNWDDNNVGETHRVYRSTSTINPASLPAPLATLGENVTSYSDTTAVTGTIYYYRVSAVIDGDEAVSGEVSALAGGFTPDDLFAASEVGAWYDPSDLSTLWNDFARTIPVANSGDLSAYVDDKSGNGFDISQPSTAKRSIYEASCDRHWLNSDGVDDILLHADDLGLLKNVGAGLIGFALRTAPVGNDKRILHIAGGVLDSQVRVLIRTNPTTGEIEFGGRRLDADSANLVTVTGENYKDDSVYVVHFDYTNSNIYMYEDGIEIGSSTSFQTDGSTSNTDSVGLAVGGSSLDTDYAEMKLYNMVIVGDSSFTAQQISDLSTWLELKVNGG